MASIVCPGCADTGHVCENHPDRTWGPVCCDIAACDNRLYIPGVWLSPACVHGGCGCGAGIPCPACCSPVVLDGTRRPADAFTPDWQRH